MQAFLAGADQLYHLAAAQHEANVPDQVFRDVNVEGTRNVLDAAVAQQVSSVVHGSTIGVYRAGSMEEVNESTPEEPDNIYGSTKLEGEGLALSYADRLALRVVRISETYGPEINAYLSCFAVYRKACSFTLVMARISTSSFTSMI